RSTTQLPLPPYTTLFRSDDDDTSAIASSTPREPSRPAEQEQNATKPPVSENGLSGISTKVRNRLEKQDSTSSTDGGKRKKKKKKDRKSTRLNSSHVKISY